MRKKTTENSSPFGAVKNPEKKWIVPFHLTGAVDDFIKLFNLYYSRISSAAKKKKPLMILGDTGVGKSLFTHIFTALWLKENTQKPITLNCAAFPESLIESELFGHVKGAFTGAVKDQKGKLAEADGGLLLLEEIGELPKNVQAKLLLFLENGGRFYPVGDTQEKQSTVQIISTTNKAKEDFRLDFWNRFLPFFVPPLYERRPDILHYFYHYDRDILFNFTGYEMLAILSYHWPGNVREIETVCDVMRWKDHLVKEKVNEEIYRIEYEGYEGFGMWPGRYLDYENPYSGLCFNLHNKPIIRYLKHLDGGLIDILDRCLRKEGFSLESTDLFFEREEEFDNLAGLKGYAFRYKDLDIQALIIPELNSVYEHAITIFHNLFLYDPPTHEVPYERTWGGRSKFWNRDLLSFQKGEFPSQSVKDKEWALTFFRNAYQIEGIERLIEAIYQYRKGDPQDSSTPDLTGYKVDELDAEYFRQMREKHSTQKKMAEAMGRNASSISSKLKKYGLKPYSK